MLRRFAVALATLFFLATHAVADQSPQFSPTTGTVSGLQLTNNYNNAIKALNSMNSGASSPTNTLSGVPVYGMLWLDTTTNCAKAYDGTSFLVLGCFDTTAHLWLPRVGGGVATIASAATTDLGSTSNFYVTISGTVTITSLGSGTNATIGQTKFITFSGASLTLTHNATSLILPNNGGNITTAAGDKMIAVYLGSGNWTVVAYQKADGSALTATGNFTSAVFFNGVISPANLTSNTNDWNPTNLATSNTIRFSCNAGILISGITAPATDGKRLILENTGATNTCFLTSQDTNSSAANRFATAGTFSVLPGESVEIVYDSTATRWRIPEGSGFVAVGAAPTGHRNARVYNVATVFSDSAPATPNNQMKITADRVVVEDALGRTYNLGAVVSTGDITTSGAGGLDTGSVAANTWYYAYEIFNPTTRATAFLFSVQTTCTAATLPSGFTFCVRMGANRTNASSQFHRVICYMRRCQYVVGAGTPTTNLQLISSGTAGATCAAATPTWASPSIANFVPATALSLVGVVQGNYNNAGASQVLVAPTNAYAGGFNTASTNPPPVQFNGATIGGGAHQFEFNLEATTIAWCSSAAGGAIHAAGWVESQ